MKKKIICLLGTPGSGKGSLSKKIIKKYNAAHISSGEILRQQKDKEIEEIMKKGQLVPSEKCIPFVIDKLKQTKEEIVVLDGVFRTVEQYLTYGRNLNKIVILVWLFCSEKVVIERIKQRNVLEPERKDFDQCTEKRLFVYKEKTAPLFETIKKDKIPFLSINTENRTSEEVYELFNEGACEFLIKK